MYYVYTRDDCGFCIKAKKLLQNNELEYTFYSLGEDYSRDDLIAKLATSGIVLDRVTVPQIWNENNYVGGYDDLVDYLDGI